MMAVWKMKKSRLALILYDNPNDISRISVLIAFYYQLLNHNKIYFFSGTQRKKDFEYCP